MGRRTEQEIRAVGDWGYGDDENFNREVAFDHKKHAFDPHDFAPRPYSNSDLERDAAEIQRIKQAPDYKREKKSEANTLEYVLMEGIEAQGWFGDDVQVVRKTTEYDDIKNGVDFVVTFEDDAGNLINLGVDATTSQDFGVLEKKLGRIFDRLDRKQLARIKYFEDFGAKKGEGLGQEEMPLVILGTDPETTQRLQQAFVAEPKSMETNPIQLEYLIMAEQQLSYAVEYLLSRFRIIAPAERGAGSDWLLKKIDERREQIDKDSALARVVDVYVAALRMVQRAGEQKSSLGQIQPERAEVTPFKHLAMPGQTLRK